MGRIYQRTDNGPYYGYWTDQRGRSKRRSLRTRDAKVATARLRELELGATNSAAYSRHTLNAAVENLLEVVDHGNADATYGFYNRKCAHLLRVLGPELQLVDLTRDHVTEYIRLRKVETASASTIHKELTALRRVLGEAQARKLWTGHLRDIIPRIKVDYIPRKTWLDEHQAKQLLARVSPERRLWVTLGIWGGLCLGEIERLDWSHVNLAERTIAVPGTKRSARARTIPIASVLESALRGAIAGRKPHEVRGPVAGTWANVRRDLARAAVLARLPAPLLRITPNDLRRTFASLMLNAGETTIVVAKLLGHASTKMVELVYGQISAKTFASAVARLPVSDLEWCAAVEQNTGALPVISETEETACSGSCSPKSPSSFAVLVPRDGVEPPTRGFSVRESDRARARDNSLISARRKKVSSR